MLICLLVSCNPGSICNKDLKFNFSEDKLKIKGHYCIRSVTRNQETTVISGKVMSRRSGEPMEMAILHFLQEENGMFSADDGTFSFSVSAGEHDIKVSFIGYLTMKIEGIIVEEGDKVVLEIYLGEDSIE